MNMDGFFNQFFIMVLQVARYVYDTFDSITFRGTSLLKYCITLILLSAVIPMLLTLVRSSVGAGVGGARSMYREATYTKRQERNIKREQIHEKKNAKAKVNVASKLR